MALTDNLLAGLLAYGTGERQDLPNTTTPTTPQTSHEDDEAPTPYAVTQDEALGFPMDTNDEEAITAAPTNATSVAPEHDHAPATAREPGALLHLMQPLAAANSPRQNATEF
jgi:hypothetical protein